MAEVSIDRQTVERVLALSGDQSGEGHRQMLGLRLIRTLADLDKLVVRNRSLLRSIEPFTDDPTSDPRYGWPSSRAPDLVEIVWPAPRLSREPIEDRNLRLSPWAVHSLLLGDWSAPLPGSVLRLPKCISLLLCDGLSENPAGHDLLRLTGQLEVLELPTRLHSQILVCGLADGSGQIEIEIQVMGAKDSEVGFAIKSVFCVGKELASFYVANLDGLEVSEEGQYWFVLRLLGEEISRLPIEVGRRGRFDGRGGWQFGQSWTWESDVFFGERQ
jgi:hypothetical protein